ncbi:MAG: PVC-type heme-binding CxxCH protein [Planctomycetota bacterium]
MIDSRRSGFVRFALSGRSLLLLLASVGWTAAVWGDDSGSVKPIPPEIAEASEEPAESMATIRIPDGWKISVWAAEPDVANIVAFDIDRFGGLYACETFRQNRGVTDNRAHDQRWLMADLQARTVQDRIDYHKRLLGEAAVTYAQQDDRVRYLSDSNGDGKADESVVVADGFNHLEEGTGAGVLAIGDSVYYTCIPKLWKLRDTDGDHQADSREVLSDGFGVRVAFRGHDLHGLIRGYDGRLYFTIGDRGYHLRTAEGAILSNPVSGAVFRCELDGSGLEVFAAGLRNPQELAFNDDGDWFTVDNNSDSGDRARLVHLLRDSDAGWRMYYQYLPDRGPFNRERIWEPVNDAQPAFIVPPVSNFTDGPSGLAYYPGTGFGDSLNDTFLICDFRGGPSNSGIRSFRVQRQGAFYKQASDDQPIWTCLATDVAFGPDGALYVSDWVDGWEGLGKGRIYKITAPELADATQVKQVQTWLEQDLVTLSKESLQDGLAHVDRRIRLESQWQLAERGDADALMEMAADGTATDQARLHAVWGLGHLLRVTKLDDERRAMVVEAITNQIDSGVPARSVASLTIMGELGNQMAIPHVRPMLASQSASVRYAAIDALGRLNDKDSIETVLQATASGDDPAMRHAQAMFLSRVAGAELLAAFATHPSEQVRLLGVVALRRQVSGAVSNFLNDASPRVALEAARAIYDLPIDIAMQDLASLLDAGLRGRPLIRRALSANYRIGDAASARRLAKYATSAEAEEAMRLEALDMLGTWLAEDPIDRVVGDYRPIPRLNRKSEDAATAVEPQIDLLLAAPEPVRLKAIEVAAELGIRKISGTLVKQFGDETLPSESRSRALRALARMDLPKAAQLARKVPTDSLRGMVGLAALDIAVASQAGSSDTSDSVLVDYLVKASQTGDLRVKQRAWDYLAKSKSASAVAAVSEAVDQYLDGKLDSRVQLNVLEAAEQLLDGAAAQALQTHREQVATASPLGRWEDSLMGGDVEAGRKLFFEKTELSCVRCHKVDRAGGEVGPNLTTIGKENDNRYLLEAICLPDAKIAKGYETAVIIDIDGRVHGGILKKETDEFVELILADGSMDRILQDDIEIRRKGNSSMPADLAKLMTARELRDLVAYLESLKVDPRDESDVE